MHILVVLQIALHRKNLRSLRHFQTEQSCFSLAILKNSRHLHADLYFGTQFGIGTLITKLRIGCNRAALITGIPFSGLKICTSGL